MTQSIAWSNTTYTHDISRKDITHTNETQNKVLAKYGKDMANIMQHLLDAGCNPTDIEIFVSGQKPLKELAPKAERHNLTNLPHFKEILKDYKDILLQDKGGNFGPLYYVKTDIANEMPRELGKNNNYFQAVDNEKSLVQINKFIKSRESDDQTDTGLKTNHQNNNSDKSHKRSDKPNEYYRDKLLDSQLLNPEPEDDLDIINDMDSKNPLPSRFEYIQYA